MLNRSLVMFALSFIIGIILEENNLSLLLIMMITTILFLLGIVVKISFKRMVVFLVAIGIVTGYSVALVKEKSYEGIDEGVLPLCRGIVVEEANEEYASTPTVYLYDYNQKIRLAVVGNKELKVNDLLEIKNAEFKIPDDAMNDGSFDYRKYLKSKGVKFEASADSENIRIYGRGGVPVLRQARQIRSFVDKRIKEIFGKNDISGIISGIFIGDKRLVSDETYENMRLAGISHIMAVSGLHVMTIMLAFYLLFGSLMMEEKYKRLILIAILSSFALITGMTPSVIRACFMIIVLYSSLFALRDGDGVTTLSFALIVICLFNPFAIYGTGMQMSFLATLVIVTTCKNITHRLERFAPESLTEPVILSLTAQIGILPVMIYSNGYITAYTLVANLIAVPLLPFIYMFGVIALVTGLNPFVYITRGLVSFIIYIAECIAKADFNVIYFGGGTFLVLSGICIALSFIYTFSRRKNVNKKGVVLLVVSVVVFFVCSWYNLKTPDEFTVTFINVGNGDCALVRGANGENVIIDTGTKAKAANEVVPYLKRHGIRKIDGVILSHFDSDHSGGVGELVNGFLVEQIIMPNADGDYDVVRTCKRNDIDYRQVSKGAIFDFCGAEFEVLSPGEDMDNDNDSSLVIKMTYNGISWLFTGDASTEILNSIENVKSDVLKVSHHGDEKCTNEEFLNKVSPDVCVISSSGLNSRGTDESTVSLIKNRSELFTTYENKTIIFICDKNGGIYFGKNKKPIKNRS